MFAFLYGVESFMSGILELSLVLEWDVRNPISPCTRYSLLIQYSFPYRSCMIILLQAHSYIWETIVVEEEEAIIVYIGGVTLEEKKVCIFVFYKAQEWCMRLLHYTP